MNPALLGCRGSTAPCQSPPVWLSSPSRSCWAAGYRRRRAPPPVGPDWRRWGGSQLPSLRLSNRKRWRRWRTIMKRGKILEEVWPEDIYIYTFISAAGRRWTYVALRYEGSHTGWVWAECCSWQTDTRVCPLCCCSPEQTESGTQGEVKMR